MTGNETVLQYLTSVPAWYLATSVDDQPHVRPFSFAAEQDGKLWFCTAPTTPRSCTSRWKTRRPGSATTTSGSRWFSSPLGANGKGGPQGPLGTGRPS